MKQQKWLPALLLAVVLLGGGVLLLWQTGFFSSLGSLEEMRAYIDRFAPFSQLFYFFIQFLSVVAAPIPSNVTALAGALLQSLADLPPVRVIFHGGSRNLRIVKDPAVGGDPGDPASRRRRQRPEVRRTGQLHRVGDVGRLLLKVPGVLPAHLVISKAGENPHAYQDRAQGRQQAAAVDLPAQAQGAGPHGRTPIL